MNNTATVLRIYPEASLTSQTSPSNGNCKSLVAVDLYETYGSFKSFINKYHVGYSSIAHALEHGGYVKVYEIDANGNKICIGKTRLTLGAHSVTAMNTVMESGKQEKEKNARLKAKNEQLEREMAEFRAWKAERDAKRKADEKSALALAKANAKIERKQRIFDRIMDDLLEAEERLNEAIRERDALLKGDDE